MEHSMETAEDLPEVVELNVGGKLFTTCMATLFKDPDSMLAIMFSGRHPTRKDKDGRFFIDCDGEVFTYILEYLRFGTVPSGDVALRVLKYADYFNIATLKDELNKKLDKQNRYRDVQIRVEPYQTIYDGILERIRASAQNQPNSLPFGVRFYKEHHSNAPSCKHCEHSNMPLGVLWVHFRLTETQFEHLPMDVCTDVCRMGYFVKYLLCECSSDISTDFRLIIACCEKQIKSPVLRDTWTQVSISE